MKTLLTGARIIDPSQDLDGIRDLLIDEGRIAEIGQDLKPGGAGNSNMNVRVIDLKGLIVTPGLIDIHTHFRDPGFEYKETVETGSAAAAAGGFSAVACMANTDPCNDNRAVTNYMIQKAKACGLARLYPVGAISIGLKGEKMAEYADMKAAGIVAISDDGRPVMNSRFMRMALEYAQSLDLPVISHAEDTDLTAGGLMHEGKVSTELGLPGIPAIGEEVMIARDILLSAYTGAAVHIAHVSTRGAVALLRNAKAGNIRVTAETAPHYFTLSDELLREFDTRLKVNPPLRSADDVLAIKEGLRDGTIDAIASDHAPHADTEKALEFEYALSGMIGLETSLALSLRLVKEGCLTLSQLVSKMSTNPAKILGLPLGTLRPGAIADITVIDPDRHWNVDSQQFHSKSRNCPYENWPMQGKAVMTFVGGEIKYNGSSLADHDC
ncbi:MAG: dihydroorotase [Deltaproteobacteria bacterium]|nr:dihydroorotase [Deltaproteobacteria bacterium]